MKPQRKIKLMDRARQTAWIKKIYPTENPGRVSLIISGEIQLM